jgi:hypothetical protein
LQMTIKDRAVWLVLIGILVAAALGLWLPVVLRERRWKMIREADHALFMISKAEWDFHSKDADGNGIHDFWTGDLAGLYKYGLIDRSIAEADAHPISPLVPKPVPRNGYFFMALDTDNSVSPPEPYRQETDTKSGKVHHLSKWGFIAYPAETHGELRMMSLNENGSVRVPPNDKPRPTYWPSDEEIKGWGRTGE